MQLVVVLLIVVILPVSVLLALPEDASTKVLLTNMTPFIELEVEHSSSCQGIVKASGESFMMLKCCDGNSFVILLYYVLLHILSLSGARPNVQNYGFLS
jgi:hypothetical protein